MVGVSRLDDQPFSGSVRGAAEPGLTRTGPIGQGVLTKDCLHSTRVVDVELPCRHRRLAHRRGEEL